MTSMFSFYLFRRYFLSSRSSSLIRIVAWTCFLGLAISVAALILVVSIMGGFGESISSRLTQNQAHLTIHFKKQNLKNQIDSFLQLAKVKYEEGIEDILFFESQELILKTSSEFQVVTAKAYSGKRFQQEKQGIVLNSQAAYEMNLDTNDEVVLLPATALVFPPSMAPPLKKRTVLGITEPSQSQQTEKILLYSKGDLNFGQYSQVQNGAELMLKNPEEYLTYKKLFQDFDVVTWVDKNSTLFFALKLEKFIMVLFIVLAIIISCLGISSALFLLITQKSKDIGILHAIGWSQKELVKTFTRLGFFLSMIGIFVGVAIGVAGSAFFKYNSWNILPAMYQDRTIPATLDPLSYILITIAALLIAWLTCYLPTKYLAHMNPSKLLKISR